MDLKKEKLLNKTYDEYLQLMLYDFPVEKINEIAVDDVTGYGTTVDEKVLEIAPDDSRSQIWKSSREQRVEE